MNPLKRSPLLVAAVFVLIATLAAELWLLRRERQQARRALATLEEIVRERDRLAGQSPALSEENTRVIAGDLALAENFMAALRAGLQRRDAPTVAAPVPATPRDAYFEIAEFVAKTRALAGQAQATIKADERFGFASHANEGPDAALVASVARQQALLQYLVNALIEARPRYVLAVQRERPSPAATNAQRNEPTQSTDFFDLAEQPSLRVPGEVESDAFRLEFTGQTQTLRAFLNGLASADRPVVVRSVEATPLGTGAPGSLAAKNLTRFAVVLECIELIAPVGRVVQ